MTVMMKLDNGQTHSVGIPEGYFSLISSAWVVQYHGSARLRLLCVI
jgi:hypothetical protein